MADHKEQDSFTSKHGQPATSFGASSSTLSLPSAAQSRSFAQKQSAGDFNTQKHPGYSLFEWNRICEKEQDLGGVGGRMLQVTPDELSKHNTENDAWTAVRGKVYNVTRFLNYHPGKKSQLMRGAGNDCTALFDKFHMWVNHEVILRKCLVGILVSNDSRRASPLLFTIPGVKFFLSRRIRQDPIEKFFGCQCQRGRIHDNPNAQEFLKNTQALRVVNGFCREVAKGNCRGNKETKLGMKENTPLPKRKRKRNRK